MNVTRTSWGAELPAHANRFEDGWEIIQGDYRAVSGPDGWHVRGNNCGARGRPTGAGERDWACWRESGHEGPHSAGLAGGERTRAEWGMRPEAERPDCHIGRDTDTYCCGCADDRQWHEQLAYWRSNAGQALPTDTQPARPVDGMIPANRVREVLMQFAEQRGYTSEIREGLRNLGIDPEGGERAWHGYVRIDVPVTLDGWTGTQGEVMARFDREFPASRIRDAVARYLGAARKEGDGGALNVRASADEARLSIRDLVRR